jgi:hypothetical protein
MKHQILDSGRESALTYSEEDGRYIIGHHIDLDRAIKGFSNVREAQKETPKSANPNEWGLQMRIPKPVLIDWLAKNRLSMRQYHINEGGSKGLSYPLSKTGVRDRFLAFFEGREFAKLHNNHVTTRHKSDTITVPKAIARNAIDLTGIGK